MMQRCAECGKNTCIHWPEFWPYRRGTSYYCSQNCMDVAMAQDMKLANYVIRQRINKKNRKEEKKMAKVSLEQKKKAVQIALDGGDPRKYLEQCGSRNGQNLWWTITQHLKKTDPETWAQLYRDKSAKPKPKDGGEWEKMPEEVPAKKPEAAYSMDTGRAISNPMDPQDAMKEFKIRTVEGRFGTYDVAAGENGPVLSFSNVKGDEVQMEASKWKEFLEELCAAAKILEVAL